jgi:electron transfer flavoprotein beta subunit
MGADKAIHIDTSMRLDQDVQPLHVAKAMKKIAEREGVDLVIAGKQSIDTDSNQTGQMIAGLLNWPQVTNISKLDIADKIASVEREADKGVEKLTMQLPGVVTADLRLNEPRFATLPNIMKARKVAIETIPLADLIGDVTPGYVTMEVIDPPKRSAGVKVDSVDALVAELKGKGLV